MNEQTTIPFIEVDDLLMQHKTNLFMYCRLPAQLTWINQRQATNTLMFLAGQFAEYFGQIIQATPEAVDQFDCPIEITPYYTTMSIQVKPIFNILMYQNNQPNDPIYILDRTGTIKFSTTGNLLDFPDDTNQHVIFKWSIRNRYFDQIPLGKVGSKEIIEVRKATPKLIKQILNWYKRYEERCESYPLTDSMGTRINSVETNGLDYFKNMSFVHTDDRNNPQHIDFLISHSGKKMMKSLITSDRNRKQDKYHEKNIYLYKFALNLLLQSGFFFKLLTDKQETTIPFVEV